ncbi:pseudouridine synthase [Boletus edulis BED1]|uniref:21S rRNA pseudouridine(2819) synthase n=1 Tax=Boletus edulis BED1 TaxID=1328754 RepID=A0AAD4BUB9_BOLED|nr:pseudouridine synthase [Boletus edulis BED1]
MYAAVRSLEGKAHGLPDKLAAASKNWSRLAIYADRGIIVLNKPPYLVCQGSDVQDGDDQKPRERNADKFNDLLLDLKDHFHLDKVPHTVHRLDKSTTGALVLAKNLAAARQLSQQFQNRSVGKTYLALVRGGEKSFQTRSGEIRDPLESDDGQVSISQSCRAKFAATDWELVASSPKAPLSLLKLTLHTGLKHQLRVHLAHSLQTPILGDPVYSRSPISDKIARTIRVPEHRLFLHASRLCFSRYRKTGPNKHFRLEVAAALPSDFVTLCKAADIPLDEWDITGGLFVDGKPAGHEVPDLDGKWLKSNHRMIR